MNRYYNLKLNLNSLYGKCVSQFSILPCPTGKIYHILKETKNMSMKEDRYIDKVAKMINEAKNTSRLQGINEGLSLYPMLLELLVKLRSIKEIQPSFNTAFSDISVQEILRIHSIGYIISNIKFWSSMFDNYIPTELLEIIDIIMAIVEGR